MPTEAQDRLASFYDEVVRRAYSGASNHWCQTAADLAVDDGVTLMPPASGYTRDGLLDTWPTLPIGPGDTREPAFILDRYAVEQAFARLLKSGTDRPTPLPVRRRLHLAEQHGDAAVLNDSDIDLVVQIAVFGRVVFGF